jgi:DNA-binding response OmpR family regulator
MDGVETALCIKRERAPEAVPVLVLTAHADPGHEGRVRASGCCDDFLAKPAPLPEIRRRLELLLPDHAVGASHSDPDTRDDARLSGASP